MALASRNITTAKRKYRPNSCSMSVIIPAAGMGYRMKSYGAKGLINIYDDVCLIERQIQLVWSVYPDCEIIVVIGFESHKVRKRLADYPVRFVYNPIHKDTNVLCSLGMGIQATISEEVLIIYGDLIFNEQAIRNLRGSSKAVIESDGLMKKEEVGVATNDGKITNFAFGLDTKWAQIIYLTEKELKIFKDVSTKEQNSQWYGYEGLNEIINSGGEIDFVSPKDLKIFEIDLPKDLEKLNKSKLTFG